MCTVWETLRESVTYGKYSTGRDSVIDDMPSMANLDTRRLSQVKTEESCRVKHWAPDASARTRARTQADNDTAWRVRLLRADTFHFKSNVRHNTLVLKRGEREMHRQLSTASNRINQAIEAVCSEKQKRHAEGEGGRESQSTKDRLRSNVIDSSQDASLGDNEISKHACTWSL